MSINGRDTEPGAATVSVFDRGFLFGDAIYEVARTVGRRPFHLQDHLDRLERSGEAIGLDVRPLRAPLEAEIARLIAQTPGDEELVIRLMITRGSAPRLDIDDVEGPPVWIVWVKRMARPSPELRRRGMRLMSVEPDALVARISPGVKSNNRQANVMAHRLAREAGFDDGLFVDPVGLVTEGPTWNLFLVRGGTLITPPLERGILAGITRSLVLEHARKLGIPTEEREVPLEEARAADEMFITSTTRGVMPVGALDERTFTLPGPITERVSAALEGDYLPESPAGRSA